jgi:flagellar biosynthesis/type III secretory pathway protein FliH
LFKQDEKEEVMQIVTSWMQEGIEQGIKQGIEQGIKQRIEQEKDLILRMLRRKLGEIDTGLETKVKRLKIKQLELLAEELLDFSSLDDLQAWLDKIK